MWEKMSSLSQIQSWHQTESWINQLWCYLASKSFLSVPNCAFQWLSWWWHCWGSKPRKPQVPPEKPTARGQPPEDNSQRAVDDDHHAHRNHGNHCDPMCQQCFEPEGSTLRHFGDVYAVRKSWKKERWMSAEKWEICNVFQSNLWSLGIQPILPE